jgi:hypothetical protein
MSSPGSSIDHEGRINTINAQGFTRLPNELLDHIFSHLDTPELHALSLTCRNATAAANHVMYMGYANFKYGPHGILTVGKHLYLFLRTLCRRPDLAAKVKSIVMMGWETELDMAKKYERCNWLGYAKPLHSNITPNDEDPTADFQLFLNAAMDSNLVPRQDWNSVLQLPRSLKDMEEMNNDDDLVRNLNNQVEDAYMVLLLALLPNLERLEVRRLSTRPILDWHHFLSKSPTALRLLKRLKIQGMKGMRMSLQVLNILPCLGELDLNVLEVQGHDFTHDRLPTRNLTKLILWETAFPLEFFYKLTKGQQLTQIMYQTLGTEAISPQIPAIPSSSGHSLKKLTLKIARTGSTLQVPETFSLLHFTNLESMVISYHALFQPLQRDDNISRFEHVLRRRVPPTVKFLSVHHITDHSGIRALEQLAVVRKSWTSPGPMRMRVHLGKSGNLSESTEESFRAAFVGTNVIVRFCFKD